MKKISKGNTKDIAKTVMNVAVGSVATSVINKFVVEPKTKLIVKIAVGGLLPMFIKNNETVKTAGVVVLGSGLTEVIDTYLMPKLAGLGLLPSQSSVGATNSWIAMHTRPTSSVTGAGSDELPTQQTVGI